MSINPAIWQKASRLSDPRLLWRVTPYTAKVAVVTTAFCLALMMGAQLPWAQTFQNYQQRHAQRVALAPILAEARHSDLTFPQVVVSHPAFVNKTVYWDVTVTSATSYAEGRPAWPIIWTNPERVNAEYIHQHQRVLARVTAVREDTVYLEFLGRP